MADQQPPPKRRRGCYKCYVCEQRGVGHSSVYPTAYGLKRHIFATHLHEKGFVLRCGIDDCPIELNNRRNLYIHVGKNHPGCEWVPCSDDFQTAAHNPTSASAEVMDEIATVQDPDPVRTDLITVPHGESPRTNIVEQVHVIRATTVNDVETGLQDTINDDEDVNLFKQMTALSNEQRQLTTALSIAELKANYNLSQVALVAAQQWAEGLMTNVAKTLIGGVKMVQSEDDSASLTLDEVFEFGEGMANPFQGLTSEWMLKKILKEKLDYVEPETVVLHEALNEGIHGQTKIYTMQYVPILDVLKLLYKDKKFRLEINKRKSATSGLMTDFMDGGYYRRHPLFTKNPNALQLQLYYDGFEVVNPLGSKIQRHNVGALYFSILNLDPAYRSTLKSICLAGLIFENDVKHPDIGWEVILRRFNSDLKDLENGIRFTVDGEEVFVQGTIAQCALDNKAAHSLFGMQDSFYGDNISRYCLCSSADIQVKAMSRECEIRDRQSFEDDLATLERTGRPANGVKGRCHLDSQYFDRGDAFAADIHHDVLEGLIPGMLKPILKELILRKRLFTIQLLNSRISNFNYNTHDAKNRPSVITDAKLKEDSRSLKQYASQYWCLLRKLPLIIGDQVPDGDEHWGLLLQLVDVVDLIMSPKVDDGTLAYLEMQLSVLFKGFQDQFPGERITPKMHYTLHYPRLMREVGPLIRHWVMRYEAKHHFFKRAAILSGNYINIPRTLAVRHQMLQVVHIHQGGLLDREVLITDGRPMDDTDPHLGAEITTLLNTQRPTVCNKVTIHGTTYRAGDAVLTGFDMENFVELGEIHNIFVSPAKAVCFCVKMFSVIEFDEHFHSWKIEKPNGGDVVAVLYDSLPDYHPVSLHYSFGNDSALYASLKYNIRYSNNI